MESNIYLEAICGDPYTFIKTCLVIDKKIIHESVLIINHPCF